MKLSYLISQRKALQGQAHLANLAFAYQQLDALVTRIDRARLKGLVRLEPCDPSAERYWPTLTALEGSQSVIEEHFTDELIADLADLLSFCTGQGGTPWDLRLEELGDKLLAPLRCELRRAGVQLEEPRHTPSALNPSDSGRA